MRSSLRAKTPLPSRESRSEIGIQEGREIIIDAFQAPISTIMGLPVEFVATRLAALGVRERLVA